MKRLQIQNTSNTTAVDKPVVWEEKQCSSVKSDVWTCEIQMFQSVILEKSCIINKV